MKLTRIKKDPLGAFGWEFIGTMEEWIKYKADNNLFPAGLYQVGRKEIIRLKLPNGQFKQFCKRG